MTRPLPLFQPRTLGSSAGGFACEDWLRQHYPVRLNGSDHLPAAKWATVNKRNCVGEDLVGRFSKTAPYSFTAIDALLYTPIRWYLHRIQRSIQPTQEKN